MQALETRLADLGDRHSDLERELAAPDLYEPAAKDRLLTILERKQRLDCELEKTESEWLEAGEELERQVGRAT
jgi:ATP-binding cassette subfamily F protein 3